MKSNEVVHTPGKGYRLRVFLPLPGATRRQFLPRVYKTQQEAQDALDLFESDLNGVDLPNCKHDIARITCGLCKTGKADASFAGGIATTRLPGQHFGDQAQGPPGRHQHDVDKRIVAVHRTTDEAGV